MPRRSHEKVSLPWLAPHLFAPLFDVIGHFLHHRWDIPRPNLYFQKWKVNLGSCTVSANINLVQCRGPLLSPGWSTAALSSSVIVGSPSPARATVACLFLAPMRGAWGSLPQRWVQQHPERPGASAKPVQPETALGTTLHAWARHQMGLEKDRIGEDQTRLYKLD